MSAEFGKLYVARIPDSQREVERHVIVRLREAYDGGMREFIDPISGDCVGCVGVHMLDEYVTELDEWVIEVNEAEIERVLSQEIPRDKWPVHETHCCPRHGCKYGEKMCPISTGESSPRHSHNNGCERCTEPSQREQARARNPRNPSTGAPKDYLSGRGRT